MEGRNGQRRNGLTLRMEMGARMLDIQPIDTAPKDGTPILTNEGYVLWDHIFFLNKSTGKGKWIACTPDGGVFKCADEGTWECEPTHWTPTKIWDLTKTKP